MIRRKPEANGSPQLGSAARYLPFRVKTVSGPLPSRTEFAFPVGFPVRSVTLDPRYLVLRWTPEYRAAAQAARRSQTSKP